MTYRTVNVKPGTFERLAAYKVAGLTYDELVWLLMDQTTPDAIRRLFLDRLEAEAPEGVADPDKLVEFRHPSKPKRRRGLRKAA